MKAIEVAVSDYGHVTLMDVMGDDLRIVDAARVSFGKKSQWAEAITEHKNDWDQTKKDQYGQYLKYAPYAYRVSKHCLSFSDWSILRYMAENRHDSPFFHPQLTFRIKFPLFVAAQWKRSTVGVCINEVSRRYVDAAPVMYHPTQWRKRPDKSIKQGSGEDLSPADNEAVRSAYHALVQASLNFYSLALDSGVAPEMARIGLPVSTYTELVTTMSLAACARIYMLRRPGGHAQAEIVEYADVMARLTREKFPASWHLLTGDPIPV